MCVCVCGCLSTYLLDKHIQILGNLGGEEVFLEQPQDLAPGHSLHLRDPIGVTEDDTDGGRVEALLGELLFLLVCVCMCVCVCEDGKRRERARG